MFAATAATCLMALVGTAQATVTVAADYNAPTTISPACQQKFGQADANGIFYTVACNNQSILRYGPDGRALSSISLPYTSGWFGSKSYTLSTPSDVAPSPDGAYLYVTQGTSTPVRLNRSADGSTYTLDKQWKLAQFPAGGKMWTPIGAQLTTDGFGNIFISNGSFWVSNSVATPGQIVKYAPDGTYLTSFGDVGPADGEWITNEDVAVSRDGRRVYVGENDSTHNANDANYNPSRVTRYDYTASGQYKFSKIISAQGKYNGQRMGYCTAPGEVNSAYTLAMDGYDNLYVVSVTCGYIQKFHTDPDPAKEAFVETVAKNDNVMKNHSIGVDLSGRVYAGEWGQVYAPKTIKVPTLPMAAPPALPAPDTKAPVLNNVTLPATTTSQTVTITVAATDDVAATEVRFANEDGTYGPWQPFTAPYSFSWKLTNGYSTKGVTVQVRDMAGNESNTVYKTTSYQAAADQGGGAGGGGAPNPPAGTPDTVAPVISSATAPSVTSTRNITINIAATDDVGVKYVRLANEDGTWSAWKAFAAASAWTITDGYVNKLVFVQVKDAAGNESATVQVKTRYAADAPPPADNPNAPADTTAPTLTKIDLPAETTTQSVTIPITASDNVKVAQVRFANEDGNWTNWQNLTGASAPWTLSANYGPKLVFAQVRDAAGNESLTVTARTSYVQTKAGPVDAADPVLTAVTLPETVPNVNATVRVTASDDVGVTQVRTANEDGNWGAWRAIGDGNVTQTLTGPGLRLVFVQVRDASGRESNVLYTRTTVQP